MPLADTVRRRAQPQTGFIPTQPGDPDYSFASAGSSSQFPAAAAEGRLAEVQARGQNRLSDAFAAGYDTSQPQFDPLQQAAEQGFTERALTLGERLLGWIDGPRQAVNLMIQDIAGGSAEEGFRDPSFGDYWNTLWGGMEDETGFELATGLNPRSGSKTIDMFGWSEEDDAFGRIGRGIVDFGFQVLTDPLTYVTFGLSGLGKKAALGAARSMQQGSIKSVLEQLVKGNLDTTALKAAGLTDYETHLVRNIDTIREDFATKFKNEMTLENGELRPEFAESFSRYLGRSGPEEIQQNWDELALAERISNDMMKPLISRDFANIHPLARQDLPMWARGGARISVPFFQSTLSHGVEIGGVGVGRKFIGDPLRTLHNNLLNFGGYNKLASNLSSAANHMDRMRPILQGLQKGELSGWQYHIAANAIDNISNHANREVITALMNSKFQQIRRLAEENNLDMSAVNTTLMNRLERADVDRVAVQQYEKLFGQGADESLLDDDFITLYPELDAVLNDTAAFLRKTYGDYHRALGMLDPTVKKRMIDGYVPHKTNDVGKDLLRELAEKGAAPPRSSWANTNDPGRQLFVKLLAAVSEDGRLETNLGGTGFNPKKDIGRVEALTLTREGMVLLDEEFTAGLRQMLPDVLDEGELVGTTTQKFIPATKLNELLEPVIRQQAEEYGVAIPRTWDGKIFSEDPFEVSVDFISSLDDAIHIWSTMDALKTAGLAMKQSQGVDVQDTIQALMSQVVRRTQKVKVPRFGKPDKNHKTAPVSWLEGLRDPIQELDRPETIAYFKELGQIPDDQAVIVGVTREGGQAFLMDGHHRLEAAKELGLDEVPVVYRLLDDDDDFFVPWVADSDELAAEAGIAPAGMFGENVKDHMLPEQPMYHGSKIDALPEQLSPIGEMEANEGNLLGPAFYASNDPSLGESYRPQSHGAGAEMLPNEGVAGARNIVQWGGEKPPVIMEMEAPAHPELRVAIQETIDEIREKKPELFVPFDPDYYDKLGTPEVGRVVGQQSEQTRKALEALDRDLADPDITGRELYNRFTRAIANMGAWEWTPDDQVAKWTSDFATLRVNERIRDAGFDAMHYAGGATMGGTPHEAYAWIRPEMLTAPKAKKAALTPADRSMKSDTHTADDIFDTTPWAATHAEKRVLREGGRESKKSHVPSWVLASIKEWGRTGDDMGDVRQMLEMSSLTMEEFEALSARANTPTFNPPPFEPKPVGKGGLVQVGEGKTPKLRGAGMADEDIARLTYDGDGFRIHVNTEVKPVDRWPVIVRQLDEFLIATGKFNYETMNQLAIDAGDGRTSRLLYQYLGTKTTQLGKTNEWIMQKPQEFFETKTHYHEWEDEVNNFVRAVAAVENPDGTLIADKSLLEILGDSEMLATINRLTEIAEAAKKDGYDELAKIMSNVTQMTNTADPKFVSPGVYALAGPAVKDLALQKDVALWLRNVARNSAIMYTPQGIAAAKTATNNFLRWWRGMATIARPSFHIRNTVGGAYMNMIHGVSNKEYAMVAQSAPKIRDALRRGVPLEEAFGELEEPAATVLRKAWEENVMSGFSSTEFRQLSSADKATRLAWARVWDVDNFVLSRVGAKFMESTEDLLRISLFAKYFDPARPETSKVAREMVFATHFNYTDLTPMETRVKSFVPFFVWTRRNLPRQIELAFENPRYVQRYRALMQSMNDNLSSEENPMPEADMFSAFAAGTDYYVNPGTPFWGRVMIDPDLPIKDIIELPIPTVGNIVKYANDMLGPHISLISDINEQREFGDVNAPAPFNAILKGLAAVGFYDETIDGDVRIPYHLRTIVETALPFARETVDPITGGSTDPNRRGRMGINPDDNPLEAALKNIAGVGLSGLGVRLTTPADVRSVAARSNEELDRVLQELKLEGSFPTEGG